MVSTRWCLGYTRWTTRVHLRQPKTSYSAKRPKICKGLGSQRRATVNEDEIKEIRLGQLWEAVQGKI
jgi:hypothetical protein